MEKVDQESRELTNAKAFTFIGDPGCDGLGTEIMSVFYAACNEASGNFLLIGGDIVPNGAKRFYENVTEIIGHVVDKPVYVLAGNHDKEDYESYFGIKNYYLYNSDLLLIVLDDSKRAFQEEALDLLKRALCQESANIVLAFHIPPPNNISDNAISVEEWNKVLKIISPVKEKVKYILCGHVHSYFEDELDGIKLIASGGGGARIEEVPGVEMPYYHFVELFFDATGALCHSMRPVSFNKAHDLAPPVRDALQDAFAGECQAHVRYRLYAEDALKNKKLGLAKLFLAAADSEFYHARNFYYTLNQFKSPAEAVSESVKNERAEVEGVYLAGVDLAHRNGAALPAYSFKDARAAEEVHLKLFSEAEETLAKAPDINEIEYSTCTSCGYTFAANNVVSFCPVCGAPPDKIVRV